MTHFTFGKHKNERIDTAPSSYLLWLTTHGRTLALHNRWAVISAQTELARRSDAETNARAASQLVARAQEQVASDQAKLAVAIELAAKSDYRPAMLNAPLTKRSGFSLLR